MNMSLNSWYRDNKIFNKISVMYLHYIFTIFIKDPTGEDKDKKYSS